jgi:hypothetical protein
MVNAEFPFEATYLTFSSWCYAMTLGDASATPIGFAVAGQYALSAPFWHAFSSSYVRIARTHGY